jgi:hypothetical protein
MHSAQPFKKRVPNMFVKTVYYITHASMTAVVEVNNTCYSKYDDGLN